MNEAKLVTDPVCEMTVDTATAIQIDVGGVSYYFCELACADTFNDDPPRWIEATAPTLEPA